jgi:hypothetical protein
VFFLRLNSALCFPNVTGREGILGMIATTGAALALMIAPAPASTDHWRQCGSQPKGGAGWYHVRAHNIGCRKARTVAHRWTNQSFAGNPSPEPLGFSCGERTLGYELEQVACRREIHGSVQKVQFQFGA